MKWLRESPWLAALLVTLVLLAAVEGLTWALVSGLPWDTAVGGLTLGLFTLGWSFVAGVALLRWALRFEWTPLAVARIVVDEALRMKIAVVFIALLLIWLAGLPYFQDPATPLRYRVQTFLNYSLSATTLLLSLMTIFLACGSLSLEVEDQRIFTTLCKPVRRGEYLLGKWLGVMLLNAILLGLCGGAAYGWARYLSRQPSLDDYDRTAVRDEVLTARVAVGPAPALPLEQQARQRLEVLRKTAPEQLLMGEDKALAQLLEQARAQWWSIGPRRQQTYIFEGLAAAKREGRPVQLRFMLLTSHYVEGQEVRVGFLINGRVLPVRALTGIYQILPLDPGEIGQGGRLELTVQNTDPLAPDQSPDVSVGFPAKSGLQVMYPVSSFEENFLRTLLVEWVRLGFLATLGLAAATCLGFPVACLLTFSVFLTILISGFLLGGLEYYGSDITSVGLSRAVLALRAFLRALFWLLQHHTRFIFISDLVDGRLVPWGEVAACFAWVGGLWCGGVGLAGWVIFRGREVGRVQV